MGDILGVGVTHYTGLVAPDPNMAGFLRRTLRSPRIPEALKDPKNWPAPMRAEWGDDESAAAAHAHRERVFEGFREVRRQIDAFKPDLLLMFGDDQYENFREEIIPPFCVYIVDAVDCRPLAYTERWAGTAENVWGLPPDTVITVRGQPEAGRYLVRRLIEAGLDMPYAYTTRHERGLAHSFIQALLFLDCDHLRGKGAGPYPSPLPAGEGAAPSPLAGEGWGGGDVSPGLAPGSSSAVSLSLDVPVVPFHVNCYGGLATRGRGTSAHLFDRAEVPEDPPGPTPARCFEVGRATARALRDSPWRVAIVGSSSWSHAFLTEKHHWLYPDVESDRQRLAELQAGRFADWGKLSSAELEDAGQHEMLNWICLAGAMTELGYHAEVVDYVETHVFNSDKCFAVFRS